MEKIAATKFKKATVIPLARVGHELSPNAHFPITEALTFENSEVLITPETLSLWDEMLSKRERDNLASARLQTLDFYRCG